MSGSAVTVELLVGVGLGGTARTQPFRVQAYLSTDRSLDPLRDKQASIWNLCLSYLQHQKEIRIILIFLDLFHIYIVKIPFICALFIGLETMVPRYTSWDIIIYHYYSE